MLTRRSLLAAITGCALLTAACGAPNSAPAAQSTAPPPAPDATAVARTTVPPRPANPDVILSTTTSTVDSGLLDDLQPRFEQATGYKLTILSQGSGAALRTAERGEADVVLAHSPEAEQQFMAGGHGTRRELVMHNDFIVVGPPADPARVRSAASINDVLTRIQGSGSAFISRGDNSGTHALELSLWRTAGIDPRGAGWYQESGTGMGQTLQIASEKAGYTLTDRGTFLSQQRNLQLHVLRENDAALLNVYHVIQVNPAKSARVNAEGATAFINFLIAPETQRRIGEYGKDRFGQPLFVPDHGKDPATLGR